MLPEAAISQSAHGRTRFRVASKRRDEAFFVKAKEHLQCLDGVNEVDVNPSTGSVLVHHDLALQELVDLAGKSAVVRVDDTPQQHLGPGLRRRIGSLNGGISRLTEGRLDLEDLALLLLIAVGLRQMAAGIDRCRPDLMTVAGGAKSSVRALIVCSASLSVA